MDFILTPKAVNDNDGLASEMKTYRAEVQSLMQKNEQLEKSLKEEKIKNYDLERRVSAIEQKDIPSGSSLNTAIGFSVLLMQDHDPMADQNIPYDEVITNVGGAWSSTAHEFQAPDDGLYLFFAKFRSTSQSFLYIYKGAQPVLRFYCNDGPPINGATMVVLSLDIGESVSVRRRSGDNGGTLSGAAEYNTFSGVKINTFA